MKICCYRLCGKNLILLLYLNFRYNSIRPFIPTLLSLSLGMGQVENSTIEDPQNTQFCILFEHQHLFTNDIRCDSDKVRVYFVNFFSSLRLTPLKFVILHLLVFIRSILIRKSITSQLLSVSRSLSDFSSVNG